MKSVQPAPRPVGNPVGVSSPLPGDTIPPTFQAAGTFDNQLGATGVQVQLLQNGSPVGGPVAADVFDPVRGVWTVSFSGVAPGTYSIQVTLVGPNGTLGSTTVNNVGVEAAPKLVITAPAAGAKLVGSKADVSVKFASGHDLQTMHVALLDAAGAPESQTTTPQNVVGVLTWGPDRYNGLAGDYHSVRVVAVDAAGKKVTATVGALKLA